MSDQERLALFAALTVALCLAFRLASASGWQQAAEVVANDVVAVPVAAMQATAHELCAPVTTLVPIPCYRP